MNWDGKEGGRGRVVGMPFLALGFVTLYVLILTFNSVTEVQIETLNRGEIVCGSCGGFQVGQVVVIVLALGVVVIIAQASGHFTETEADEDV
jgi:hypothetical protein